MRDYPRLAFFDKLTVPSPERDSGPRSQNLDFRQERGEKRLARTPGTNYTKQRDREIEKY